MQRIKQDRQIVFDRTLELLLLGLCVAASIYGLVQLSARAVLG